METKIFNQRLIKFAKHLAKIKSHPMMGEYHCAILYEIEKGKEVQFEVCLHAWLFLEMHLLFPEDWYYNDKLERPFLNAIGLSEDDGFLSGVFDFFNLSPQEFAHLFDINNGAYQQLHLYGGRYLFGEATGEEISKQIFEFIMHKTALSHFDPKLN